MTRRACTPRRWIVWPPATFGTLPKRPGAPPSAPSTLSYWRAPATSPLSPRHHQGLAINGRGRPGGARPAKPILCEAGLSARKLLLHRLVRAYRGYRAPHPRDGGLYPRCSPPCGDVGRASHERAPGPHPPSRRPTRAPAPSHPRPPQRVTGVLPHHPRSPRSPPRARRPRLPPRPLPPTAIADADAAPTERRLDALRCFRDSLARPADTRALAARFAATDAERDLADAIPSLLSLLESP